ncbi:UNVERIFIED_CONTAM: hypothetical protein Slati_3816200 [Sesamum latifolium]|uniref:DUF4218 domain-containing protein n=1 Tax=Sesamum latifolium TaxID=2727402 RepID=A0AAW2U5S5_9LAMI
MEHLPIHLAEEVLIAGAVQYRWMYPIESTCEIKLIPRAQLQKDTFLKNV